MPADAISDPKDVIGRGLILPVIQNEPILPMKLRPRKRAPACRRSIPPGLRAVSVRVNEVIGVAGYVAARDARRRRSPRSTPTSEQQT